MASASEASPMGPTQSNKGKPYKRFLAIFLSSLIGVFVVAAVVVPTSERRQPCACITEGKMAIWELRSLNGILASYQAEDSDFPPGLALLASGGRDAYSSRLLLALASTGRRAVAINNYRFVYTPGPGKPGNIATYTILAEPVDPSNGSTKAFFTDESSVIRVSVTGRATVRDRPIDHREDH